MKWMTLALLSATIACNSTTSNPPRATASGISSPQANFAQYQTFMFGPANPPVAGYSTTERSLETQRKLAVLVERSLQARGYRASSEKSDLVVKISTGSGSLPGDKIQRGNAAADAPAGFIGIDAYDGKTGVSIWHGSAYAEVDPERMDDGLLARGVEHMLAGFPARHD
jgi:hypothetical protein